MTMERRIADNAMKPIVISIFVAGDQFAAQGVLDLWLAEAAKFDLMCEATIFDIFKEPMLARQFSIVATPTTIIEFSDGRKLRWVGYSKEVELLIRTVGQRNALGKMRETAESMSREAKLMYRDAVAMLDESKQMRIDAGIDPAVRKSRRNPAA